MKKSIAKLIQQLKRERERLGKDRDRLRVIRLEAGDSEEDCERALESLEDAIDKLSELH